MRRLLYFTSIAALSAISLKAAAQNDPSTTVGDTGTVTFTYRGNTVTYVTVRAADDMIWLQQNLGSSKVASSATDTSSYGHLFQWGRWDDGHQLRNSATAPVTSITPNNPAGLGTGNTSFITGNNPNDWWAAGSGTDTWADTPASTSNGIDPCRAIGPGWHMPSQPEFANAVTLENITNVASGFSSNLKLPAPGTREGIFGNLINVGTSSGYYTNTPSSIYAKNITIYDSGINSSDDALRSYAMSLRCMAECTGVFPAEEIIGEDTVCSKTTETYSIAAVNNANGYIWTVPAGWTITGPSNGVSISVITGSTTGSISVKAMNSCDTSDATMFTVNVRPEANPVITAAGNTLSTGTYAEYQWLFNEVPIPGAQSQNYTATNSGDYRVRVVDASGCIDTSAIFNHTVLSIDNKYLKNGTMLYPNPANTVLNVKASEKVGISIYSLDGRLVAEKLNTQQMDIRSLPAGVYQVRIHDIKGRLIQTEKLTILRN